MGVLFCDLCVSFLAMDYGGELPRFSPGVQRIPPGLRLSANSVSGFSADLLSSLATEGYSGNSGAQTSSVFISSCGGLSGGPWCAKYGGVWGGQLGSRFTSTLQYVGASIWPPLLPV